MSGFEAGLLEGLCAGYSHEDLKTLCFKLGVDDQSLGHDTRDQLARELIVHMRRVGRLGDLLARARAERPAIAWPAGDEATGEGGPRPAVPRQLPEAATHFTGRGPELDKLQAALRPGHIVTLYGPGGIGKTAVAAEALRALPPALFPDGILFHTFYGRPAAAEAAAAIARAYGLDPRPDPFAAATAALRRRVALLVFDGAEEADDLDALLALRGGGGVLITSRRREDVRETGIEVERLPGDEALALLRALAGDRAADETAARAVCELVGNLPLALRLAGAFLFRERQTAAEYAGWLRRSPLQALDFGERRRQSVAVLLARSAAQVGEAARAALGVAGCLALAPFDAGPVAAALGQSEDAARRALGQLVNYELLRRPDERYEVSHALVYAYARDQQAVAAGAVARLGNYYAALAERESAAGLPGYRRLGPERGHILAVLGRLAAAGEWATANDLVWVVQNWLDIQGYPWDRLDALATGLAAARALGQRRDEGAHLTHLGLAYADLGRVEEAIGQYEAALAIAREIGDRRGEGIHLGNLGNAYAALGRVEEAIGQYEAALAIAREIGDRRGEGNHLYNRGLALEKLGRVDEAMASFAMALAVYESIHAPHAADARAQLERLRGPENSA